MAKIRKLAPRRLTTARGGFLIRSFLFLFQISFIYWNQRSARIVHTCSVGPFPPLRNLSLFLTRPFRFTSEVQLFFFIPRKLLHSQKLRTTELIHSSCSLCDQTILIRTPHASLLIIQLCHCTFTFKGNAQSQLHRFEGKGKARGS